MNHPLVIRDQIPLAMRSVVAIAIGADLNRVGPRSMKVDVEVRGIVALSALAP